MASVEVQMVRDKETARTWRFRETADPAVIGVLYVPKTALKDMGEPQSITVTITPGT